MPRVILRRRLEKHGRPTEGRSCPAHRAWIRRHHCCVPGCMQTPIECAHVRTGTDCGLSLKPSDRWAVSLCRDHHRDQHRTGEAAFQKRYGIDLYELALEFARRSPHRQHLLPRGC